MDNVVISAEIIQILGLVLAALIPMIIWGITLQNKLSQTIRLNSTILDMVENPQEHGLVTEVDDVHLMLKEQTEAIKELHVEHAGALKDLSRAVNGLTAYLRWAMDNPGQAAPPQAAFEAETIL
jgi:hypothetical protein